MASRTNNAKEQMKSLILGTVMLVLPCVANAQTQIFVENNSEYNLIVSDAGLSSGRLSKKAWKKGVDSVPSGQRVNVLSINRTGKFNWMDPTPRFVEPGKTVVFSAQVTADGIGSSTAITLKQKLLGVGSTSKMWHAIAPIDDASEHLWVNDDKEHSGTWQLDGEKAVSYVYRSYVEDGETHVEYIFNN